MQLTESIRLALSSIKTNRMRSFLTMLGIIIGISSVITISAIGSSVKNFIEEELKGTGYEMVELLPNWMVFDDAIPDEALITKDEMDALTDRFENEIVYCAPYAYTSGSVKSGRQIADVNLMGANVGLDKCDKDFQLSKGRFISDKDVQRMAHNVVIDEDAAKKLFGNTDPIGKSLQITINEESEDFTVVGVYKNTVSRIESLLGGNSRFRFYIPYSVLTGTDFSSMYLELYLDTDNVENVADKMASFLNRSKRLGKDAIMQTSAQSEMEQINSILDILSLAIAAIAAISLLVGGIGIMNIMLVSVTERTKEIGIRKALGARTGDILRQFLIEAVILSVIGGIIGILLGTGVAGLAALILGAKLVISIGSIVGSVSFSIIVGVVFGLFPARKAARMNPIDALRYE